MKRVIFLKRINLIKMKSNILLIIEREYVGKVMKKGNYEKENIKL